MTTITQEECSFFCEVPKGYIIKILIDTLVAKLQKVKLILTSSGIYINETDEKQTIFFNIELLRQNFKQYKCTHNMCVKLNLKFLQRLIRSIKKKDSMTICILKKKPNVMYFNVSQEYEDSSKQAIVDTNYAPIEHEEIPDKFISPTEGYNYPVIVPAQQFQKIKKLIGISVNKLLHITIQRSNYIKICTDDTSNSGSVKEIGKLVKSFDDEIETTTKSKNEYPCLYSQKFDTDHFSSLIKLSGLQQQFQFYSPIKQGHPLLIKLQANTLGTIDIFIKDIELIRYEESQTVNELELVNEKAKRKEKKINKGT